MTGMYRRRAGEPVKVWEVGTEPVPEWAADQMGRENVAVWQQDDGARGMYTVEGEPWLFYKPAFDRTYEPMPSPDVREALEIAKDTLQRIVRMCPATCDMSVAHSMAEEAEDALARMGGGNG